MLNSVRISVNSTVTGHMPCASTHAANDICCEVTLFRTVVLAMTNAATVLTDLVFIIAQGAVQGSELAKLVTLVIILTLRSGSSLW